MIEPIAAMSDVISIVYNIYTYILYVCTYKQSILRYKSLKSLRLHGTVIFRAVSVQRLAFFPFCA